MISVKQLVYKLDMKLNSIVSSEFQSIPLENKILALREAVIKLVKKKVNTNNNLQAGLDTNKKRYEDLQILAVPYEKLTVTKSSDLHTSYAADLTTLQNQYMFPLDMYCIANRGNCVGRIIYIKFVVKHADLGTLMANNHYNPSFLYQETLSVVSEDKMVIYGNDEDGDFEITNLYISYLRYPAKLDLEGYLDFDGNPSTTVDCDLEDYLEDELLDLAVLELAIDTTNQSAIQGSDIRFKTNE